MGESAALVLNPGNWGLDADSMEWELFYESKPDAGIFTIVGANVLTPGGRNHLVLHANKEPISTSSVQLIASVVPKGARGRWLDCPWRVVYVPSGPLDFSAVTWNPNDKDARVLLKNNNLTAYRYDNTNPPAGAIVRTTRGSQTGKLYVEFTYDLLALNGGIGRCAVGLCTGAHNLYDQLLGESGGWQTHGWGYRADGNLYHDGSNTATAACSQGDVVMMAVDFTNGKVWFGRNGTWHNSGDPANDVNPSYTDVNEYYFWAGDVYPAAALVYDFGGVHNEDISINLGASSWAYTPPEGFVP